jgi:hypothetical protein
MTRLPEKSPKTVDVRSMGVVDHSHVESEGEAIPWGVATTVGSKGSFARTVWSSS